MYDNKAVLPITPKCGALSGEGWGLCCLKCHFQQYFTYTVTVSFIGVENQSTRRDTSQLSHITDKLYHIMLFRVYLPMNRVQTHICGDRH